jgi:SPP1 gp7 family putative phage head morphogenesis protein
MPKTSEYWKERFGQVEESQHQQGLECYEDIESQYRRAQKDIEGKLAVWYQRLAKNNGISLTEAKKLLSSDELEEFKWDVKEYIKNGKENAKNGQWMKQLENASARYHISRLEAIKIQTQQSLETLFGNQLDSIDSTMRDVYTSGYYRTAYEIQKGVGVGWEFAKLDDRTISKVINKPWAADGKNFSARVWSNREKLVNELNKTLAQNIILGQDPQKAIDEIARKMNTSKQAAGRLVMTEEAFFSSAAQKDCFKELDVEQYEIVATLDSRTSEICQDMDGKHFFMSEWEIGITAPPFHVNCRTTTVPYFDDDFDAGERAARNEDGKVYYVPADMTYKQWKKEFVDGDKSELKEVKTDDRKCSSAKDVKEQWISKASHTNDDIEELNSYVVDGTKYTVDNHNVVFGPSENEKHVASVLVKSFGGKIELVPRVLNPQGIKTPDYIFNGEKYDLKTVVGTSKNVLYNALKGKREQAENFVFDISQNPLDVSDLQKQAELLFESKNRAFVQRIILLKDDEILNVFERNK